MTYPQRDRRRGNNCLCGRNAGAERCQHCQRMTCAHCHHGTFHLANCPGTKQRET